MTAYMPDVTLSLTDEQHNQLQPLLFPPDGYETAAIALCGGRAGERRHRLVVREIHKIPDELCSKRTPVNLTWPTDIIVPLLDKAEKDGLSVIKIHCHPSGYRRFSAIDDAGDQKLLPAICGWVQAKIPHGSVVMLPNGQMFGRVLWYGDTFVPITCISVTGPDLRFWHSTHDPLTPVEFTVSHSQAFGQGTTDLLRRLSIAVIGCSGTGGPIIEQLVRLGVGELVLVDNDHAEERNINRIPYSTLEDARQRRPKVEIFTDAIQRIGLGTQVRIFNRNLWDREVVRAVAECDVVFGCMDTVSGRFLLNTLATYYTIPYFDLGVRLDAVPSGPDKGRIREICGTVHYLQPGRSSLISRGLFSMEQVAAEGLQQTDPAAYAQQLEDGYIRGVQENRPAVISVNMYAASLAVNDFLARLHPYREQSNSEVASITFSLSSLEFIIQSETAYKPCQMLQSKVGWGDIEPLLGLIELAERKPA
jgi:hypothetical protein